MKLDKTMRMAVYMAGVGRVAVTRKQGRTIGAMGAEAIGMALKDANMDPSQPTGLYVGNMLSGILSSQQHLGPYLAGESGMRLVDATVTEACCGSGGAALRWGCMALESGYHETVVVAGVEAMTHTPTEVCTRGLAMASHWEKEGGLGETFVSLNSKAMRAYMDRYGYNGSEFGHFAVNAHENANKSPEAVFNKKPLDNEGYLSSPIISDPVKLMDACPTCDGAAAVVLTTNKEIAQQNNMACIEVAGSGSASDSLALSDRESLLTLAGVTKSTKEALARAGLQLEDVDIYEAHDAYTIMSCLSLESAGFVEPGEGVYFTDIGLDGKLPLSTFGGLKARGHPVGASGVYQAVESYLQLTRQAGANQVAKDAHVAMIQTMGGAGTSVYTHILTRS
eukprot:m.186580 g.186580  ORF g.186580 m.186580 type:complete len:394 (+) comp15592_c0_seq14:92-1273(+)